MEYHYDGLGTKLAQKGKDGIWTYYCGNVIYKNNQIYQPSMDEGRINVNGEYEYALTDHLGNVRVMFKDVNGQAQITQAEHFGPWGESLTGINYYANSTNKQNFVYTGHERQDDLEGVYDAKARHYDPITGRFWGVDPHASSYAALSPYSAMGNNPISIIDPDGADIVYFNTQGGEAHRIKSNTEFRTFIMANGKAGDPKLSVANWKEVAMPKIIQERTQSGENTTGSEYQANDYLIAARTGYFNQSKNAGILQLYTDGGKPIPKDEVSKIPDLDPTLVKAASIQESNNGVGGNNDLLTANNKGDYATYKAAYGLTKDEKVTDPSNSLYYGIRFIATKGFKGGITYDPNTGNTTYTFQGWLKAAGSYNGGGVKGYQGYVETMYNNAQTPKPENYVKQ